MRVRVYMSTPFRTSSWTYTSSYSCVYRYGHGTYIYITGMSDEINRVRRYCFIVYGLQNSLFLTKECQDLVKTSDLQGLVP